MDKVKAFGKKFSNDWSMNLASMLTYSLITTITPIIVAILSLTGLVLKLLPPSAYEQVALHLQNSVPAQAQGVIKIQDLLHNIVQLTGPLAIVSLVGLLWGGSNLFTNMENIFSIVYRVRDRDFLPQRLMAIGMVIVLSIMLPASVAASSLVTAGSSAFQSFLPKPFGVVLSILGPLSAILILWLLFLIIYRVVPNMKISFRNSWKGAAVAAGLFSVFDLLFPLYFKYFLSGNSKYGAALLSVLVLIAWLWFFAVVTLVGAQVNAVVLKIAPLPFDLPRTLAQDYEHTNGALAAGENSKATQKKNLLVPVGRALHAGASVVKKPLHLIALVGWLVARPFVRRTD